MRFLNGSVGLGGKNHRDDVIAVQTLLASYGFRLGRADGVCGPRTLKAIKSFQQGFMRMPDGRIDAGGMSSKKLAELAPPDAGPLGPVGAGALGGGAAATPLGPAGAGALKPPKGPTSPGPGGFKRTVPKPAPGTINVGLTAVSNSFMMAKLGKPRKSFSADCQPITNPKLKGDVEVATVGPLKVQGLKPAVASLREVLADIQREQPDVYAVLGTAGMLCCRFVRGSTSSISNHSWGTAIDLNLEKVLDSRGDNKVQYGLTLIAPIFSRHGWYWGAAFPVEDAMHFEGSKALIEKWAAAL